MIHIQNIISKSIVQNTQISDKNIFFLNLVILIRIFNENT